MRDDSENLCWGTKHPGGGCEIIARQGALHRKHPAPSGSSRPMVFAFTECSRHQKTLNAGARFANVCSSRSLWTCSVHDPNQLCNKNRRPCRPEKFKSGPRPGRPS